MKSLVFVFLSFSTLASDYLCQDVYERDVPKHKVDNKGKFHKKYIIQALIREVLEGKEETFKELKNAYYYYAKEQKQKNLKKFNKQRRRQGLEAYTYQQYIELYPIKPFDVKKAASAYKQYNDFHMGAHNFSSVKEEVIRKYINAVRWKETLCPKFKKLSRRKLRRKLLADLRMLQNKGPMYYEMLERSESLNYLIKEKYNKGSKPNIQDLKDIIWKGYCSGMKQTNFWEDYIGLIALDHDVNYPSKKEIQIGYIVLNSYYYYYNQFIKWTYKDYFLKFLYGGNFYHVTPTSDSYTFRNNALELRELDGWLYLRAYSLRYKNNNYCYLYPAGKKKD